MVEKNSKNSVPKVEASSLAGEAYCTYQLIKVYDLCNECDKLDSESELFKRFKKFVLRKKAEVDSAMSDDNIDEEAFDDAASNDALFNKLNFFDNNGVLNDEILLKHLKEASITNRDKRIAEINELVMKNSAYEKKWNTVLSLVGAKDTDNIKNNKDRGDAEMLREKLYSDFVLYKEIDPNNNMLEPIEEGIKKQIDDLPYFVRWVRGDIDSNHEVRKYFSCTKEKGVPIPRKEFLSFVGKVLSIGEDIARNSAKESLRSSYYDDIREACGCPEMKNAEISLAATKAYRVAVEGCWKHKNQVNEDKYNPKDKQTQMKEYASSNISAWISELVRGKNDIAKLAFLKGEQKNDYLTKDEMWKIEMNEKHVTVDHNIDLKYHALFDNMADKKMLNGIWNLTLIIGGKNHEEKTDESENKDNKKLSGNVCYYKVKIYKAPNAPLVQSYDNRCSFIKRDEPPKIKALRVGKPMNSDYDNFYEKESKNLFNIIHDNNKSKG